MIKIYKDREIDAFLEHLGSRSAESTEEIRKTVSRILSDIRTRKDAALLHYTARFDQVDLRHAGFQVSMKETADAASSVPPALQQVIEEAAENIRRFHQKGRRESWLSWDEDGIVTGQRVTPLDRVGLYVPGGRAVYPSSLLMTAIPAQVAGVREIAIVSPPDRSGKVHPAILATAAFLGIDEIYKVGGAQAIGALAFGTETIPGVDKIVGPGNAYVAEAKRQVFGRVAIDMIAGPSEVVILADDSARPDFVAADLLAQAEHDPAASSVCVTPDAELAARIAEAVETQARGLKRGDIIGASLRDWGGILVPDSMEVAFGLVNRLAAEHLGLHVREPWEILKSIRHAGAVFLGHFAPETVGDYWAGPNHVLPTNRTARFASPLGTQDFLKFSSLIAYPESALKGNADAVIKFAELEGLDAHANAVRQRLV
ncbi:MAG TPA: histidinol dehydrogenase [bacterium]|nr:histidinol dehydrogenase [bacterium]